MDISSIDLTEAQQLLITLAREGISATLRIRLEPGKLLTSDLEKAVRDIAPEIRLLLAKQGIEDLLAYGDERARPAV